MHKNYNGFSLIEAMITVLVLSIGLLGLGQLQARLHFAAQQGAENMYASIISSEFYEKSATYGLSTVINTPPTDTLRLGPSNSYTVTISASQDARTSRNQILIQWPIQDGTAETGTTSLFNRPSPPFNARWLLGRF